MSKKSSRYNPIPIPMQRRVSGWIHQIHLFRVPHALIRRPVPYPVCRDDLMSHGWPHYPAWRVIDIEDYNDKFARRAKKPTWDTRRWSFVIYPREFSLFLSFFSFFFFDFEESKTPPTNTKHAHMSLVAFSLDKKNGFACFDIQDKLRSRGWVVRAYTYSKGAESLVWERHVCRCSESHRRLYCSYQLRFSAIKLQNGMEKFQQTTLHDFFVNLMKTMYAKIERRFR